MSTIAPAIEQTAIKPRPPIKYRILSLDGGGAKGVYSLGFLSRLESDLGKPLCDHFDLIYGTSTGAIIATLISLGHPIEEVYKLYLANIPGVLSPYFARTRSVKLRETVALLLQGKTVSDLRKPTGIVATNWDNKLPLVFKNYDDMAHSGTATFIPLFGATLVEAVCASCSAVPMFKPVNITLKNRGDEVVPAYDGGFCANNPSLFALVDAQKLGFPFEETALISVGVGHYPSPRLWPLHRVVMWCAQRMLTVRLLSGVLEVSSKTTGVLQGLLLSEVRAFRADELFNTPELGTDLLETNLPKLKKLFSRGTQTYQENEDEIRMLL